MDLTTIKTLIKAMGFTPKEHTQDIFIKKYQNSSIIKVDFFHKSIVYDPKIQSDSKTTQNFVQDENFVVLECVNRLLEMGYKPENIILEKTYPTGHNTSGRLDILVTQNVADKKLAYLMIECKTFGTEYQKELNNIHKFGGQLFTYFGQDRNAELLMLYASKLEGKHMKQQHTIIKIKGDIRKAGNVQEMFEYWDKATYSNGVFENPPYDYTPNALTFDMLLPLEQNQSSVIFNQFLETLRHNVVSDKPNAFNKIFSLFLCKIYDELEHDSEDKLKRSSPLDFQYIMGESDETFQLRLNDLYKRSMKALLDKTITDISLEDFDNNYNSFDEVSKKKLRNEIIKLRLQKNNEFAIKDVFDESSFKENARVVREIVTLLQKYRLRHAHKNQFLSDFFELLLTTGLKQEAGQFFTTVPIAQFILRSLPLDSITQKKLIKGEKNNLLPRIIDYASGSGHFLTESMNIIQQLLENNTEDLKLNKAVRNFVNNACVDSYSWAHEYIYGIEKDYRLVKVGKVGCYLHGDGLANVIHSDGLARFTHEDYQGGSLSHTDVHYPYENKRFDVVVSNPPYSVSGFKNVTESYYNQKDFELYQYLTEQSSEIEALFIERTKQLLNVGGVAGIILPTSILSNTGIYTKAREIILLYFDIVAIAELGSNTFMYTGTNTVVLFLKRRENNVAEYLKNSIDQIFLDFQDRTLNAIENALLKYINHVWGNLSLDDYLTLIKKTPSESLKEHELFTEYRKKFFMPPKKDTEEAMEKSQHDFWEKIHQIEKEKLLYFILSYKQKTLLINSGEKDIEKRFLGYEFSNRRGSEGIHPIKKGKKSDGTLLTISDCTKMFDEHSFTNSEKASTYVYQAFQGVFPEVHESLKEHIYHSPLVDMINFERSEFDKILFTKVKKKIEIESRWPTVKLKNIITVLESGKRPKGGVNQYQDGIPSLGGEHIGLNGKVSQKNMKFVPIEHFTKAKQGIIKNLDILICKDGALTGKVALFRQQDFDFSRAMINEHIFLLRANFLDTQKYLFHMLFGKSGQFLLKQNVTGTAQGGLNRENLLNIGFPLPPLKIQQKIVCEIEELEKQEKNDNETIKQFQNKITRLFETMENNASSNIRLTNEIFEISIGRRVLKSEFSSKGKFPVFSANVFEPFGMTDKLLINDFSKPSVLWGIDGDWQVNYIPKDYPFYPTDHCGVLRVKDDSINPKYLAFVLDKIGREQKFSRNYRASIDRISNLKIPVTHGDISHKVMIEIENLESEIIKLKKELHKIPQQKEDILKKYL